MATIEFVGTVINSGTLALNDGDTIVVGDGTTDDATLTGGGTVELVDSTSITPFGADSVLTNQDNLIAGGGVFSAPATIDVTLINEVGGVVGAVGDDGSNQIYLFLNADVANDGLLSATHGGSLVLNGITVDNSGSGSIFSSGGSIFAGDPGSKVIVLDATISGGLLATDSLGSFSVADGAFMGTDDVGPIVIDANVEVVTSYSLTLSGTVLNIGDIALGAGASLIIDGSTEVSGGGLVDLSSSNTIEGGSVDAVLENVDNSIVAFEGDVATGIGGSTISVDLVNIAHGEVGADGDGAGQGLLALAGAILNYGVLFGSNGGKLVIAGMLENVGEVVSAAGGIVAITGGVEGSSGQLLLTGGGEIDIAAEVDGIVTFAGDGGIVRLAGADDFVGVWSGAAGVFDLQDVPAPADASTYSLSYVVNDSGTGGVLSLSDGVTELWSVDVAGQYDVSDFSVGDGSSGGTLVSGSTVATTTWFSGLNGQWLDPGRWDAGVPGRWSQAELGPGSYRVTVSGDQTVYGISTDFGATLRIADGTFWANGGTGTGLHAGTIIVRPAAAFNVSGNFFNAGLLRAVGADATIGLYAAHMSAGTILLQAGAALEGAVFGSVLTDVSVIGHANAGGSTAVHATLGGSLTFLGGQVLFGTLIADGAAGDDSFGPSSIAFGDTVVQQASLSGAGQFETLASTITFFQNVTVAAGATFDVVGGSTLDIQSVFTNDGTTEVGDAGGSGVIEILGNGRLEGGGTLRLVDGVIVTCGCETATLINNTVILGSGQIGNAEMKLVNNNDISAFGGDLVIDTGAHAVFNRGVLEGGDGGLLTIESILANEAQLSTSNAGGALSLARVINRANIDNALSGSISGNGSLTNEATGIVTNQGDYDQHSSVVNHGFIQNIDGTFTVDGIFSNLGSVQVDDGLWELVGRTVNRSTIATAAGSEVTHADLLNNVDGATLTTAGSYAVNADLMNGGSIDCLGGSFTVSGSAFNEGSIAIADGASFTVNGRLNNGLGTLTVDGGTLSIQSKAAGGSASVTDGGLLEFDAVSTVDVSFDADANTLVLGQSTAFTGDLSNFVTGNLVAFLDMASTDAIHFAYTANADDTGGMLRVFDTTAALTAKIQIEGSGYTTADFFGSTYDGSHFAILSQHPAL